MIIAFEGIDRSGKSTQAALLCEKLKKEGLPARLITSPSDTDFGNYIRNQRSQFITQEAIFLMHVADFYEQLIKTKEEEIIIFDRYVDSCYSSMIHQGLDYKWIKQVTKELKTPDLIFLMDLNEEKCLEREIEDEADADLEWQKSKREYYDTIKNKEEVIVVNALQDIEKIATFIYETTRNQLG